ncbi:FkbM family methyltransferase [Methylobacterium sp. J-026]|uniref:FkbM family methyltransferase n=1 Tax=Methylobacterium sp. J-026 TaxID=2836624 RepID=UPI001FBAF416|nr:FkbM family methyltransferase [Methylobacterium sp. J-026]MCJ2132805.1 FkbM family methyltransferase [Methylobacterium sp. J-026]
MNIDNNRIFELERVAEFHAFSVRQLIAQRERLFKIAKLSSNCINLANAAQIGKVLDLVEKSSGQFYQDIFGLLYNRAKQNGFFVEFGACDGLFLSNTALLEKEFGWAGIVAEPMPTWHAQLAQNRKCLIEKRCVWRETKAQIQLLEYKDDEHKTESRIAGHDSKDRDVARIHTVETVTLTDMLTQNGAPNIIDLMSIDVEGGELDIIADFAFDRYKINFLTIEQHAGNAEPIRALMEAKGYTQVLADISGHDGFYVPRESAEQLGSSQ